MILGALFSKRAEKVVKEGEKDSKDKPFDGIRNVSDNHIKCGVVVPADGTAKEIPVPEGYQIFISEDGKPMIRKKVEEEAKEEPMGEELTYTYTGIAKSMYSGNDKTFFLESADDSICTYKCNKDYLASSNCMTEAQVKRIKAFNKLQNIAKYFNGDWNPDFYDTKEHKFYISFNGGDTMSYDGDEKYYNFTIRNQVDDPSYSSMIYFKNYQDAVKAIGIMGEESLNDLFNANW